MRRFLFTTVVCYTLLGQVLSSCGDKASADSKNKVPAGILNEDAFTKVLVDFALAESVVNLNVKNANPQRLDTVYAFDPLKENHVSKGKYDSTLLFYSNHIDLYKKVYENVLTAISELQTRSDSIRRLVRKDSAAK